MIRKKQVVCNCGYKFTNHELEELEECPKCNNYFCYNCGSTAPSSSNIFGFYGTEYSCSNCGEFFG